MNGDEAGDHERRKPEGFGTRALSAAARAPAVTQQPDAVPIYQSVTFRAQDSAELGEILGDRQAGYAYSRVDNPTTSALADALAELEGAEAGYVFASGMAAVHAALISLLGAGDEIVAPGAVYGSTHQLLAGVLARFGVQPRFVDISDLDEVAGAITPRTRILYTETISNPTIVVADLPALAAIAHSRGLVFVVDNTFASPYLCRPLEQGADLVVESCTKWLGGHSDVLAGAVLGSRSLIERVRAVQIDTGGSLNPFAAFLVLRGIETLHVRMDRHSANALALARALESAAIVRKVYYPALPAHPQYAVARRLLRQGGGMLAFDLGPREAAAAFIDALRLGSRTASLGSVRTMWVHPPSTTHRQLGDAGLAQAGIRPGLVRVSVGLEEIDDLLVDSQRGLAAAEQVLRTTSVQGTKR